MIKSNTVLRAICTLAVVCAFAGTVFAQSVLNFTPKGSAGIGVTNTTPTAVDVKFIFYNRDGTIATAGLTNNASYRIPAGGQLAMMTSAIFRAKSGVLPDGWLQATSAATGLQGFYFSGDFWHTFDGAEAPSPFQVQTIPFIASGPDALTTVLVTNPGSQSVEVTVSFNDAEGRPVVNGSRVEQLVPHAQLSIAGIGATARVAVNSGPGVLATAVEESATALALIHGQSPAGQIGRWVVPYFKNGDGFVSMLALANPSPSPAPVAVSFYNNAGERAYITKQPVTVPGSGSYVVSWRDISGALILPPGEGWLLVESNSPLTGVALVSSGGSATAIPMQASGLSRILFSRAVTQGLSTRLVLVGDSEREATVKATLSRADGSTASQKEFSVRPLSRVSEPLGNVLPTAGFESGFLTITSSVPIFSLELMELPDGFSEAVVTPQLHAATFAPSPVVAGTPVIRATVEGDAVPGALLTIDAQNVGNDATLWVGGQSVSMRPPLMGTLYTATLPPGLEPGAFNVKIRNAAGLDSNTVWLDGYSVDRSMGTNSPTIRGYALFQKVEVTDNGLDTTNLPISVPIRHARVEVVDPLTRLVVSVSKTDENGSFVIRVPDLPGLTIRIVSRLYSQDLKVLDNSANNSLYVIPRELDSLDTNNIELVETSRSAGAFNILDALQKGNALIMNAAPGLIPPALTVYWSEKNDAAALAKLTNGSIRTTFFNAATNSAYILGDRNTDSDEFDDAVILHEYAHLLAAKFSRDDSNGGQHLLGDSLDPRIAWSEGWANFFSSAARGSSIYRDSKAGNAVLRLDIEENVPVGDHPGYSSEASVDGLLWDLIDENADKDDTAQFSFAAVWIAFTELRNDRNVYLPYFLERFVQRNPTFSDGLRTMVIARSIDFQPEVRPSVTNPFPRTIAIGGTERGQVDSFTTKRTNLSNSSHFFSLTVTTGGQAVIRLAIESLGAANNPSANDLDLFLYDATGKKTISQSDGPYNGGGEIISTALSPGTYIIEIRSFYVREQTNSTVFNSGGYRLSVDRF